MPKLPQTKPREAIQIVKNIGFVEFRIKGSHHIYKHFDGRMVVIAYHNKPIPTGTLKSIIEMTRLTPDEFFSYRKKKR